MKIYTSYFANYRKFNSNTISIGITRFPPKWWKGKNLKELAPSEKLLRNYRNGLISEEEFAIQYKNELWNAGLTPGIVKKGLEKIGQGHDIVLCCYEKPEDFCHRKVLADWLSDVVEFEYKNKGES